MVIGILIFVLLRRKYNKDKAHLPIRIEYTEEFFYALLDKNPHILSLNDLSEELNVSLPTLHAKIKNISQLSPLQFLIQIKKKIALDLYHQGESMENIAKRTGYSVRYVKSKLLKK